MYVAIYEFKIKDCLAKDFEESWATWTDAIYRCRGSLGSRLHIKSEKNQYVAYAQWPSKEAYESEERLCEYTADELEAQKKMKLCCESLKTPHLLDVLDDRFRSSE
jgi:heme-degrading monooxygenase HmoA